MQLFDDGITINNKWHVERFLGEGAFAEVYRVRHRIFGRQAMKVFKRIGMQLEDVEEILQEPILLAGINHPNIIRVFDADTVETSQGINCFFTMEYVAGGTLERFWKSHGERFVPVESTVELMRQVASGLSIAHRNNPPIVHRDIKPQNVLVGYDEAGLRARIADFGLAKRFNLLTMALTGLGTRSFKPPEVLANRKADSPAGDIWALGSCFYLLLTDRFPFDQRFDMEMSELDRFEAPLTPPSSLNPAVDSGLDEVLYRCLALNPKDRFSNASELHETLQNWSPRRRGPKRRLAAVKSSQSHAKPGVGRDAGLDEELARSMVKDAIHLAREVTRLSEAADLLEEAFNRWPQLRAEYDFKVKIWRRGISG